MHKEYIPIMIFYYGQSSINTSHVNKHTDGNLCLNCTKYNTPENTELTTMSYKYAKNYSDLLSKPISKHFCSQTPRNYTAYH